jgi:hypothetical protein
MSLCERFLIITPGPEKRGVFAILRASTDEEKAIGVPSGVHAML